MIANTTTIIPPKKIKFWNQFNQGNSPFFENNANPLINKEQKYPAESAIYTKNPEFAGVPLNPISLFMMLILIRM